LSQENFLSAYHSRLTHVLTLRISGGRAFDTIPRAEFVGLSDGESECDVPINDDSPESHFTTFSNPLFDSNDDFSIDDELLSEEEILKRDLDVVIPFPAGIDERCFNDQMWDILPLEELLDNVLSPLPESDDFTVDVEPVAAVTNDFDVLNNDEPFDPGRGENVVFLNVEEDDTVTLTIRTFLPFVTYPEASPLSCSTGSEDTIFDPGIST
ncbi:hypothetical protein Tco_0917286, partial [Tanacetum coccineum]